MKGKLLGVFLAGLVVGVVVTVVGWQSQALAQKVEGPRWEYKVTTFPAAEDKATKQMNELADDGWEYGGLTITTPGHESLVAFRRPKK